ncbi:DNA end-binding protein Ku [Kibdelosporangium banguiense]|uniref:Non-homologous end joining protein Ku n=1 Tax=Kibdelosporangium banguiense TaxID=1365924 RepID=A0ABS4TLW0_9PSEU|nr:Ku protein [Kibdelosporangium banguiense]MBP2325398.1 DNA end-binding protein Ku [Kibdelosporangium banguiense]
MRAVWRGTVSIGLVSIAVRVLAATQDHDFRFHHVHRADAGRIRYRRECEACGEEIDFADVARGYELPDGRLVLLGKDDFESLPSVTDRAIRVVHFVPAGDLHPIFFQRSYYLEPEDNAVQPYVLLRLAMERTQRAAIVKIAMRRREVLAALHTRGDMMMLHTMLWPDEVRPADFPFQQREVTVRPQELTAATALVTSMSAPFRPEEFTDDYQQALAQMIDAKADDAQPPPIPPQRAGDTTMDLLEALRLSVERARLDEY